MLLGGSLYNQSKTKEHITFFDGTRSFRVAYFVLPGRQHFSVFDA